MPDVYFNVYRGKRLIRSTEDSVLWNFGTGETALTIEVEGIEGGTAEEGDEHLKTYTVTGTVTSSTSPGVGGRACNLRNLGIAVPAASLCGTQKDSPRPAGSRSGR